MPNHIQNRLRIIGTPAQVNEVLKFISSKDEDGKPIQMDFNKIRPMPIELLKANPHSGVETWVEICTGQINFNSLFNDSPKSFSELFKKGNYSTLANSINASTAMELILGKREGNVKDFSEEDFNTFIQCLKNYREYGNISWYKWSLKNWETKWNAYGQNDERNTKDTIHFETAWSAPIKLISELSSLFPNCSLQFDYSDEDSGSNVGKITFKNGESIKVIQPESQSKEAYEIYFELHPNSSQNYKLVGNKYEYVEE